MPKIGVNGGGRPGSSPVPEDPPQGNTSGVSTTSHGGSNKSENGSKPKNIQVAPMLPSIDQHSGAVGNSKALAAASKSKGKTKDDTPAPAFSTQQMSPFYFTTQGRTKSNDSRK